MQFLQPDIANFLFERDQPLDHNEYFLIMPDAIGHGESSKPSSADGPDFPQYSYMDIA
jgi:homoserine O-acetyltransferase